MNCSSCSFAFVPASPPTPCPVSSGRSLRVAFRYSPASASIRPRSSALQPSAIGVNTQPSENDRLSSGRVHLDAPEADDSSSRRKHSASSRLCARITSEKYGRSTLRPRTGGRSVWPPRWCPGQALNAIRSPKTRGRGGGEGVPGRQERHEDLVCKPRSTTNPTSSAYTLAKITSSTQSLRTWGRTHAASQCL